MSGRKGIMLCYPFEEKRLAKWQGPTIVQPKLDGERCRAIISEKGEVTLLSSEENVITSVPHINEQLMKPEFRGRELDGELYLHGSDFEYIHSIVSRTVNPHPLQQTMEYHIFDVINERPQYDRSMDVQNLPGSTSIKLIPNYICDDLDEVLSSYDKILESGYEGIIVRNFFAPYIRRRSTFVMKFKPKKDDFYVIIGYKEELSIKGKPKDRLGALICKGDDGTEFSVGSGLTDELRVSLWEQRGMLVGNLCHVAYQHITSGRKVPRFPVFMEVVESESDYVGLGGDDEDIEI